MSVQTAIDRDGSDDGDKKEEEQVMMAMRKKRSHTVSTRKERGTRRDVGLLC